MSKLDVDALKVKTFDPLPAAREREGLPDGEMMDPNQPPSQGCTTICTLYTMPC